MKKIDIQITKGDHCKEIGRVQALLMPQELKLQREGKISEYEFQKRCLLRTQLQRLMEKINDAELTIEELGSILDDMPRTQRRKSGKQGNIFNQPA